MRPKTVLDLQKMKADNCKIAMITAYDATMAKLVDSAGVRLVALSAGPVLTPGVVTPLPPDRPNSCTMISAWRWSGS